MWPKAIKGLIKASVLSINRREPIYDMMFRIPEKYQIAQLYFTPFEQCCFVSWLSREYDKEKEKLAQEGFHSDEKGSGDVGSNFTD